jgi:hypothetical protein
MAGCAAGTRNRTAGVRAGYAAVAAVFVLLAAGCADEPEFEWPEDPVAAPMPTVDAGEAAAADELLAAFEEFRQTEITVHADPQPPDIALDQLRAHLADPLLAVTLFEVEMMHHRGLVREGEPVWEPAVVDLRLDETPPTATVRDCLDASGWRLVNEAGGGPASTDGLPARFALDRYVMEFDAMLVDGQWLFEDARVERNEQC